jgi:ribonuclease BN (tRNA processing enzyme)
LLDHVYARDINFRVAEEWAHGRLLEHPRAFLEVNEVLSTRIDLPNGVEVTSGQVEHGSIGIELSMEEWSANGYRVSAEGRHVAVPGDAVAGLELMDLTRQVDALVMCAYLAEGEIRSAEDAFLAEQVLAGAPQAAVIAAEANVDHLILTHIREKSDAEIERMRLQVAEVFGGTVTVGSDLMTIDV